MKILFKRKDCKVELIDPERRIFSLDGKFVNESGEEIQVEEDLLKRTEIDDCDEDEWDENVTRCQGLDVPLKAETIIEPLFEIDDMYGQFGFKNKKGKFVIEPQFAYAYDFTNGLAAVNLGRTWYRTDEGKRCYENHFGYIDSNGKTVIGFQYDEAHPFNKYGVAVVYDIDTGWHLIDKTGKEIPGTRFVYLSRYYDYDSRFLEFSYEYDEWEEIVGIYDTKERKILMEPSVADIMEDDEDHILVYSKNDEYGLFSSKGEYLIPMEYENIVNIGNNIWACYKNGEVLVVETE